MSSPSGLLEFNTVYEALSRAGSPAERWACLTDALAKIGLTEINYAYLDFELVDRMDARGDPAMSTMARDWIAYYSERRYDLVDDAVDHVRLGNMRPMLWSGEDHRLPHYRSPLAMKEAVEAGLRAGLVVPLAGPTASSQSAAGIMLGSSFSEDEFVKILGEHGQTLVALAHVFHTGAAGELMRHRHGVKPLSARERDCLRYTAAGLRPEAIAEKIGVARVTVDMHMRNARKKLGARTPAEAVARGLLYQQIEPA